MEVLFGIFLKELRKTTELSGWIACVPAEIRTENLPDANIERFLYTILFGIVLN
jgi:hypothetical protein